MGLIKIVDPKKELKTIITDSNLSDKQKAIWYNFIQAITEQSARPILKTLQEDAAVLGFLTENLEEKLKAMQARDKNSWDNIVKKEKEYIEAK